MALWAVVGACGGGHDAPRQGVDTAHPATTPLVADSTPPPAQSSAAGPGGIEVYSAGQLSRIAEQLARSGSTGRTFGGHPTFHYVESRRVVSGSPEIHDDWIDVTLVQTGQATFLSGGHVNGGSVLAGGEHRGGTIAGGSSRAIAVGDVIIVPAGTPHQFQLARGDSIRYLTIKVKR